MPYIAIYFTLLFTFFGGIQKQENPISTHNTVSCSNKISDLVFRSFDKGTNWEDISQGLPYKLPITSIVIRNSQLVLGTDNSGVYFCNRTAPNLWKHEDLGDIFPFGSGFFPNDRVLGMYHTQTELYASVYNNGLFKKIPGTPWWQAMFRNFEDKTIYSYLENTDGTMFITTRNGIYKSSDTGHNWKHLYNKGAVFNLLAFNTILVGSSFKGIIHSLDGGETWINSLKDEKSFYKPYILNGRLIALRSGDPKNLTSTNALWEMNLENFCWKDVSKTFLKDEQVFQILDMGEYLFCSHKNGISRSRDGGKTWELVKEKISEDQLMRYELVKSDDIIYAVSIWAAGC